MVNHTGVRLVTSYIIIELDDGLSIVEVLPGQIAEAVAEAQGGVLIDEGPFATLEEAQDALDNLEADADEE